MDPDHTAQEQSGLVHTVCLYAKNRFEKFARIFSRRHKQTTFSDARFLGVLRVKPFSSYCPIISDKCYVLAVRIHIY